MVNFELHTERLLIRNFNSGDALGLISLSQDEKSTRYTEDQKLSGLEEALNEINSFSENATEGFGKWAMILKDEVNFSGWCSMLRDDKTGEVSLGMRVLPEYRNKGLATEAASACINFGFGTLLLERIIGKTVAENPASSKVLRKIGMKHETDFEGHGYLCEKYSISIDDWRKAKGEK
ncbi:MAG: N-acetyltransferase [Bacteroidetes bacterium]|nr:MAG: N-acetyltransferase [Bacteroidota bacterium]REK08167.1 MAG: N-acetyltransferase [Bacteroidota bacterium]REK32372.1 MAG: N-acetyltransferase [Bacteroidota bacterium]REK49606.1 MAG: N-acetyltransferase [Bacteroidota bacterium]